MAAAVMRTAADLPRVLMAALARSSRIICAAERLRPLTGRWAVAWQQYHPPSRDAIVNMESGEPAVAVIVCTRNRSKLLERCLTSIRDDGSSVAREIVVVDNASTDDTAKTAAAAADGSQWPMRVVRESELGLSWARNRGLAETRAPIVLFTDDDVQVRSGWADSMFAPFEDPSVGAVGGRIFPDWETRPPAWLQGWWTDLIALRDYGPVPLELSPEQPPIGANMAVRRAVLPEPAFSPRLGYRGSAMVGSCEIQLFDLLARDHRIVYEPSAVVTHFVPTARMTRSAMRRACLHNGMGASRRDAMRGVGASRLRATWSVPRTLAHAVKIKVRNDRSSEFSAEEADAEFLAFTRLGRTVDAALGSKPGRVADWITTLRV